ncbi:MAG: phospholipid/cholesterol/gamma-HCH transport system substrate-binding protein [Thermoleophilaceae bacterium]|jgi:phospholipid/cholesterol/gamma-HCH transport system substrate-binding protein|nr:phospholipid/cholesterol/gamma-HCH transport system substrate-binding protein [Thermoleophilaceae bacterium]
MVISMLLALAALVTFLFLNSKFEGPDPTKFLRSPFELTASFKDTKKLPTKQPVLYKGIPVGHVNRVTWDPEHNVSVVTFTLEDGFEIHQDAVLQIGERSLLGDPYLNLATRGSDALPRLASGDVVEHTEASVNFDEALDFLDERGRRAVKSLISNVAEGVAPEGNGERLNGTVGGLSRTLGELNNLTNSLKGQEGHIAGLVQSASTVLSEIGSREQSVRTIVGSGRITLDTLAANTSSLDSALQELPRLLDSGRRSLAEAQPLLSAARPVAAELSRAAPDLTRAFKDSHGTSVGDIVDDLNSVVGGLRPLRRQAEPVLGKAAPMLRNLNKLVEFAAPTARLLTPALAYLEPRVDGISGLYALVAAAAKHKDSVGHYARVGVSLDPAELLDQASPDADCNPKTQNDSPNQGFCNNAYPGPHDALDPQPFQGKYPKIEPCTVPSRKTPTKPCK